jgi:hypothetical protein
LNGHFSDGIYHVIIALRHFGEFVVALFHGAVHKLVDKQVLEIINDNHISLNLVQQGDDFVTIINVYGFDAALKWKRLSVDIDNPGIREIADRS